MNLRRGHVDVLVTKSCQAVGVILLCVLFVTDANLSHFQQPHDRGDDLLFRQSLACEIALHARANLREDFAEVGHTVELCLIANLAPARMVSILLPIS